MEYQARCEKRDRIVEIGEEIASSLGADGILEAVIGPTKIRVSGLECHPAAWYLVVEQAPDHNFMP